MRFALDDDQLALQDAVRRFCAARAALERAAERDAQRTASEVWDGLAQLGVFSLLETGDEPGWPVEAAVVFEELGRHLVTGPVLWSAVAGGLVPGADRITGVDLSSDVVPGMPVVVDHHGEADVVVVVDHAEVQVTSAAAWLDGRTGTPLDPLTPSTAFPGRPAGTPVGDAGVAGRMRDNGVLLSAASLVGVAQGALDTAVSHALEREQFGVPIGSFQAVKHLLADMYVRVELARAQTLAAAALVRTSSPEARRAVTAAKVLAADAGRQNGRVAVQVLGGMGFTWDMLPHLYLKRAWVLDRTFGSGDLHAERLGSTGYTRAARTGEAG